jgi:pyruvate kinase
VANAVWDGTDVVMLSGETSVGKFAVEAVEMMQSIISETEEHLAVVKTDAIGNKTKGSENIFDPVGRALATMAVQVGASAVVSITRRGNMARSLSKFRPRMRIVALSDNFELMNVLKLVWGVYPIYFNEMGDETEVISLGLDAMREKALVKHGDTVIFTSGAPADQKGPDIWIRFATA